MHLGRVPATALIVLAALIPLWVIDLAPSSDAALPSPKAPSLDGLNRTVLREYLPPPIVPRPAIIEKMVSVQKGDTLMTLLVKAGIPRNDARNAIAALSQHYSPKSIRPGQNLNLNFQERDEADPLFLSLIFQPTIYEEISVHRVKDKFAATKAKRAIERRQIRAEGEITDNLYNSAIRAGIAPAMLMELIRIYSWDVDFQRGIRPGDEFKVMYEGLFDEDGNFARHGNILYADLILSGESTPLTRFTTDKGRIDYFDDHGKSARKALMRTPIDGARLSSGYGRRRHPILGYTKMHKGLDFAAARGTPIYAAGSGTIVYRARKGAYGKYIRIRHNSE
ncbi:MAG: peptidoglycan DD-metalloendopeptidase family protein [Rhodospirillales bacterium]|nr:peptidoglycan DD-metalloendopeptidase family protein [Rhodospirillales bacterium]